MRRADEIAVFGNAVGEGQFVTQLSGIGSNPVIGSDLTDRDQALVDRDVGRPLLWLELVHAPCLKIILLRTSVRPLTSSTNLSEFLRSPPVQPGLTRTVVWPISPMVHKIIARPSSARRQKDLVPGRVHDVQVSRKKQAPDAVASGAPIKHPPNGGRAC